jgi:septum formation protein|tara:strand:- start:197 stop:781 length:585 start_codon:yes stop_codon:yes gene_type:complete
MQPSPLVLASASPRRKELLDSLGILFDVQVAAITEDDRPHLDPQFLVMNNAALKAEAVMHLRPNALVLGSDTTVALEGRIFSKPKDNAEALSMLRALSGKWHSVYTAVSLRWREGDFKEDFFEVSQVEFKRLSDSEIINYHAIVNPLDKAGAYGIQEASDRIIKGIKGSFETIMGLPTESLEACFKKHGFDFSK